VRTIFTKAAVCCYERSATQVCFCAISNVLLFVQCKYFHRIYLVCCFCLIKVYFFLNWCHSEIFFCSISQLSVWFTHPRMHRHLFWSTLLFSNYIFKLKMQNKLVPNQLSASFDQALHQAEKKLFTRWTFVHCYYKC
jgi:hypothetical protein